MIRKFTALTVLLLGLAAAPAMAQPAIQIAAPLPNGGFISVGTPVAETVVVEPVPVGNYYYYHHRHEPVRFVQARRWEHRR